MDLPVEAIVAAVRAAGDLAEREKASGLTVCSKGKQDFVTQADRAVERFLRPRLVELLPGSEVLGEEFGGPGDAELLWAVDPIDGTTNYIRGLPHWCISVGLVAKGELRFGTIFAPTLGRMYVAEAGRGATLNERRLRREAVNPASAIVNLGQSRRRQAEFLPRLVAELRGHELDIRLLGSGAMGLAETASGEVDGAIEGQVSLWDIAAGLVIAREAGCRVNDFLAENSASDANPAVAAAPGLEDLVFGCTEFAIGFPIPRLLAPGGQASGRTATTRAT